MNTKEFLTKWYESKGPKWCAEETGKSYGAIKQMASSMGLRWADSRRDQIRKHLEAHLADGWGLAARQLNLSEGSVRRWAKKLQIQGPPDARGAKKKEVSDEQSKRILDSYPQMSCVAIGNREGLTRDVVERVLRDSGAYLGFNRRSDVSVDKTFFEWGEDLAYVLGYMFSDGSVGKYGKSDSDGRTKRSVVQSSITSKDRQILDDIRERMGLAANVCPYVRDGEQYYHLTTNCKWVYEQWRRLGVNPRKTYEGLPIPDVPEGLVRHFIRGFFDGDGSGSRDGYSLKMGCSDVNFLIWMRNVLVGVSGGQEPKMTLKKTGNPFFSFVFYADRAKHIKSWMAPSVTGLRLKRKWTEIA